MGLGERLISKTSPLVASTKTDIVRTQETCN